MELAALYRGGCTLDEIGKAMEPPISRERVRQIIRAVDEPTREAGETLSIANPRESHRARVLGFGREMHLTRRRAHYDAMRERVIRALQAVASRERRAPGLDELYRELWPEREGKIVNPSSSVTAHLAGLFGRTVRDGRGGKALAYALANVERPPVGARHLIYG